MDEKLCTKEIKFLAKSSKDFSISSNDQKSRVEGDSKRKRKRKKNCSEASITYNVNSIMEEGARKEKRKKYSLIDKLETFKLSELNKDCEATNINGNYEINEEGTKHQKSKLNSSDSIITDVEILKLTEAYDDISCTENAEYSLKLKRKKKKQKKKKKSNSSEVCIENFDTSNKTECNEMCKMNIGEKSIFKEAEEQKRKKKKRRNKKKKIFSEICVENLDTSYKSKCNDIKEMSDMNIEKSILKEVEEKIIKNENCVLERKRKKKKKRRKKKDSLQIYKENSDAIKCLDDSNEISDANICEKSILKEDRFANSNKVEKLKQDNNNLLKILSQDADSLETDLTKIDYHDDNSKISETKLLKNSNKEITSSISGTKTFPVYVGNLKKTITESILIKFFSDCGSFKIKMITNLEHPICFLVFFEEEGANKALEKNNLDIRQRKLVVSTSIQEIISKVKEIEENKNRSKSSFHIISENSIMISAISKSISRYDLYQLIAKEVEGEFILNYNSTYFRCIVHLFSEEDFERVLKLHDLLLDGRKIIVQPLEDPSMGYPQITTKKTAQTINIETVVNTTNILTLFIANLPYDVRMHEIKDHFSDCGPIKVHIERLRFNHRSKVGFLEVTNLKYYKIALAKYDTVLGGSKISVFESGVPIAYKNESFSQTDKILYNIIIYNYKNTVTKEDISEVLNLCPYTPHALYFTQKQSYLTVHSVIEYQNILAENFAFVKRGVLFLKPNIEKHVLQWKKANNEFSG